MMSPERLTPLHDVEDSVKYHMLIKSMRNTGWVGAPIVVHGSQAITGSHRIAAATAAGIDIPTINVADCCTAHGADWDRHLDNWGDWYEAARRLDEILPTEAIEQYGIDIH